MATSTPAPTMGMYDFSQYQPLAQPQRQMQMTTIQPQYPVTTAFQPIHPQGPSIVIPAFTNVMSAAVAQQQRHTDSLVPGALDDVLRAAASTAGIFAVSDTQSRAGQNLEGGDAN